jgi:hypothetical protein
MRLSGIALLAVALHWFLCGYSAWIALEYSEFLFMRLLCIGPSAVILHGSSRNYSALTFMRLFCIDLHAAIVHWSSRGYSAFFFTRLFCIAFHAVILDWSSRGYSALVFLQLFFIDLYVAILHFYSFMTGDPRRRRVMQHSLLRQHYLNIILLLQLARRRSVEDLGMDGRVILKWTSKIWLIWKVTKSYYGLLLM